MVCEPVNRVTFVYRTFEFVIEKRIEKNDVKFSYGVGIH